MQTFLSRVYQGLGFGDQYPGPCTKKKRKKKDITPIMGGAANQAKGCEPVMWGSAQKLIKSSPSIK